METTLPQTQRPSGAGHDDPIDGSGQRAADNLGSLARQTTGGQALGSRRQSLWRKRAGQGSPVHERDSKE